MSATVLVACYSMTGHTRELAEEITKALGADLIEIREPHTRKGFSGVIRALFDAVRGRLAPIIAPEKSPADYRIVVLGGPVWAGRLAAPVRRFARDHGRDCPSLACFCSLGGSSAERAFDDIGHLSGQMPVATLAVDAKHLDPEAHERSLQAFLGVIRSHAT